MLAPTVWPVHFYNQHQHLLGSSAALGEWYTVEGSYLHAIRASCREAGMAVSNTPELQIRRATLDDVPAIAEVLRVAFAEYTPLYTSEGLAATTPSSERIAQRFDEGPIWVAERVEAIVATVAAAPREGGLYVRSMAALPSARGLGVGRLLFAQVEAYAADEGFSRLFLSTTPFLMRAIRLYEALGFRRSDDGPNDLFGTPLFTMIKTLPLRNPA